MKQSSGPYIQVWFDRIVFFCRFSKIKQKLTILLLKFETFLIGKELSICHKHKFVYPWRRVIGDAGMFFNKLNLL